jgi:hypothetical protein
MREHVGLTNALHDRIKRHAPCALRSYCAQTEPCMLSTRCSQDLPCAVDSVSHAPVGTVHKHVNAFNALSSKVPGVGRGECSPIDTSSLLGPAAKRRRWEAPTLDERWDQPNSRPHLAAPEGFGPIHHGNVEASACPATGTLASVTTSDQDIVASALVGVSTYKSPQCGSVSSQQYNQQASTESYDDIIRSINESGFRDASRSDNSVQLDSFSGHNIANPLLQQPRQGQPSWMNFDQGMIDFDFLGAIPETRTLGRPF